MEEVSLSAHPVVGGQPEDAALLAPALPPQPAIDLGANELPDLGQPPPGRDSDRFFCPYPGCNRSFAELWRLKVHYRAPPDVRGSGKERGHGTELAFCPKCQKALKPGKHHVGCAASRNAPRAAKRKGGDADNKQDGSGSSKAKRSGDGGQQGFGAAQGGGPAVGAAPWPLPPDGSMPPPPYGYGPPVQPFAYWQTPGAYPTSHLVPPGAPAYGVPPPAFGYPAAGSGQLADHHMGGGGPAMPGCPSEPATGIPVMGYPAGPYAHPPGGPPPAYSHTAQHTQQPHAPPPALQPPPGMRTPNGSSGVLSGVDESGEPEFLASLFNEDEAIDGGSVPRSVPSPPPLPDDFLATSAAPNRLLFNFGQFNQKMPGSLHQEHATRELTDNEALDLAEQHVVYDHTDDGELMQMLFGMADDVPTMATIHLHTWHNLDDEDRPVSTGALPGHVAAHGASGSGPAASQQSHGRAQSSLQAPGWQGDAQQLPSHAPHQQEPKKEQQDDTGADGAAAVQGHGDVPAMPQLPGDGGQQLGSGAGANVAPATPPVTHGTRLKSGVAGSGGGPPGPVPGAAPVPTLAGAAHCQPNSEEKKGQLGELRPSGGDFLSPHHLDLMASCGD